MNKLKQCKPVQIKSLFAAILVLVGAALNSQAQTTVIGFTAATGYTNGNLSGQKNWTATSWLVNTNGNGYATVTNANYANATYALGTPLILTNGYSGLVDFSFSLGATNASALAVFFFDINDSNNGNKGPNFEFHTQAGGAGFEMDIYNTAAVSGGYSSVNFSGASIGITNGIGTSANLRFSFTTTPTGGGTNWTTVLTLTNLTTGTLVSTVTQNWTDAAGQGLASVISMASGALSTLSGSVSVDQFAIGPNYYPLTYNAGAGGTISGTTPQTVAYLASGSPMTAVANAGYNFFKWSDGVTTATRTDTALVGGTNVTANFAANYTIGFTAAEGYTNGNLSGQKSWYSPTPTAWQVNTNGLGSATVAAAAGDWANIKYDLSGSLTNGYTGSVIFTFTVGTAASSNLQVINFTVQDTNDGSKGPQFYINAGSGGAYTLGYSNSVAATSRSTGLTGTNLGLNATGTGTTAKLWLTFTTVTNGMGTWTTAATLMNLNTGTMLGSLMDAGWTGEGWATSFLMQGGQLVELFGSNAVYQVTLRPPYANVINFTAAQGYTNGNLNRQSAWNCIISDTNVWQVTAGGLGYAMFSSTNGDYHSITYGYSNAFTNGYIGLVDFTLTLGNNSVSGAKTLMSFTWQDPNSGNQGPAMELKAQSGGGFSWDIWNTANGGYTSSSLVGTALGFTNGIGTVRLRLSVATIAIGVTNWTTVMTLANLNTSTPVGTLTQNWTGEGWFQGFNMGAGALNTVSGNSGFIAVDQIATWPVGPAALKNEPLHWAASGAGGIWDTNDFKNMIWQDSTVPTASSVFYQDGDQVSLDDTCISASQTVTLSGVVNPGNLMVSNNLYSYTIAGSGSLSGATGLVKSGTGRLTLAGTNSYAGATTINAGTLALSGSAGIPNSAAIIVASNAIFDVSGLTSTFTLGAGQTLGDSAEGAILNGNLNTGSGTLSLVNDGVNPAFIVTNGTLTFSAGTTFNLNYYGPGTYKIIAKASTGNVGSVAGTLPSVAVINGVPPPPMSLALTNGELWLTVSNPVYIAEQAEFRLTGTGTGPLTNGYFLTNSGFGGGTIGRQWWLSGSSVPGSYDCSFFIMDYAWVPAAFCFTPASSGTVTLSLMGPYELSPPYNQPYREEVLWDACSATGTTLPNGSFESVSGGLPTGWSQATGDAVVNTGPVTPVDGTNYLRVWNNAGWWNNAAFSCNLSVTAGVPVTLYFHARSVLPPGFTNMAPIASTATPAHLAARQFMRGINLCSSSATTNDFINMRAQGFDHVRIGAIWDETVGPAPTFTLSPSYFAYMDFMVTNALNQGLAVMLCPFWPWPEFVTNAPGMANEFYAVWQQVAVHYSNSPANLAFELHNEPGWGTTTSASLDPIYASVISRIRLSNPNRTIFVDPCDWNFISELNRVVLPDNDSNLVVTVHCYDPNPFTGQGAYWSSDNTTTNIIFPGPPASPLTPAAGNSPATTNWITDYNSLPTAINPCSPVAFAYQLRFAAQWAAYYGRPVHIGEFGAYQMADPVSRDNYCAAFRSTAESLGLGWCMWDWYYSGHPYWNPATGSPVSGMANALFPGPQMTATGPGKIVLNAALTKILRVDRTQSLAPPVTWMPLQTNTMTNVNWLFTDPAAGTNPGAFYRGVWLK